MSEPKSDTTINLADLVAWLAKLPEYERRIKELEERLASQPQNLERRESSGKGRKWITQKEAAAMLSVSTWTVRNYITRGFLRKNDASRNILIPLEDVENFVKKVTL